MIKAIIIDDEQHCVKALLTDLQKNCPVVEVTDICHSAKEGIMSIKKNNPDLIFLDVEMPWMNGFEMLEVLGEITFSVIFTTAHDEFAAKAFRISAIDYLLKPIDIGRLKFAVARVLHNRNIQQQSQRLSLLSNTLENKQLKNIVVSDKGDQHIIAIEKIIAIEAQESYCIIYTGDKQITVSKNLKHFETVIQRSSTHIFCPGKTLSH